ncbi:hypothetical protein C8R44DRAFT_275576 [Mycena epipterygia]|nr:hypothetical protein C8R44DRAFT_275576 [Mycena epipterygia]
MPRPPPRRYPGLGLEMKYVDADDGQKQCQRCKRANVKCVFEKHRRGRKPGSKLSEASEMLRRLKKGLNNAKFKSQAADPADRDYLQREHAYLPVLKWKHVERALMFRLGRRAQRVNEGGQILQLRGQGVETRKRGSLR